nr:putative reverse transcriptase domain-containing protein [Tanacetum cinerariifolium]
LSYVEEPEAILDRQDRVMRKRLFLSSRFFGATIPSGKPIGKPRSLSGLLILISFHDLRIQAARDHQKSYADVRRKPLEFQVLAKVGTVAYRLELPEQLSRVHSTFHVSNLKKCLSNKPLVISLDEIHIDEKLRFIEEPSKIMDSEVKWLKQSLLEEVSTTLHNKRTLNKCRILSLANKALLMGEDCNN